MIPFPKQLLSFATIGVLNTTIHGLVLALSIEQGGAPVVLAHLIAFCFANVFSYGMNSFWTFKKPMTFYMYLRFLSASLVSLSLTLITASVVQCYGWHYWVGFALVTVLVPVLSFLLMKFWTFRK